MHCRDHWIAGSDSIFVEPWLWCNKVSYTARSHTCGELRLPDVKKDVVLCGWLQYERFGLFLLLRDWHGMTQLVIPEDQKDVMSEKITNLPFESVLRVHGCVRARPEGQTNEKMNTGEIEVVVKDLHILNRCTPRLPFEIKDFFKVKELLRMQYRYLDIRRHELQRNLRLRSKMVMKMRQFLSELHEFVEVETPTLFRKTPGGAKEFVVPSRYAGKFYSLPQSPQQFKQLLMVGGIDRYYQIARCYRDEGAKPDRQPEFTQVDIEMSFVDQEGIMRLTEELVSWAWPEEKGVISLPFRRMTYQEAMTKYGSDKPDTRLDMLIQDVSDMFKDTNIEMFHKVLGKDSGSVQALRVPGFWKHCSNKDIESLITSAKKGISDVNVVVLKIKDDASLQSGVIKNMEESGRKQLEKRLEISDGDLVFMAAGFAFDPHTILGRLRLSCADLLESKGLEVRDKSRFDFLWVHEFPLFLPREDGADGLESAHHPFTAPHPDDVDVIYTHPEMVRSQHYDLVLNGNEIGGGSIRIHNSDLQRYVIENILKENAEELEHLLEALDSGCPPHGGIALGLDRFLAVICGSNSIRDVIAFPKSHDGKDPMSKAPADISQDDMDRYHISVTR
ncbi:aspartate--tRNA ligase, mitochondrial-like isoform X2 [Gigantopelta aegis]|uniref:aspartate--tRNA ligase, mitochondrial-like isoform X2 n=1 Tax=Gigantopelta aegis TaxID=1735272 RepID=UPI001B88C73C|nr:aspartate--tRNA ligase, mitochondrial-like isoform X2 [Gigantopelta aegis]